MCHKYPYRHKQNLEILKACKTDAEMEEWMEHNASHILDMLATEVDRLEQIIRVILH
jgi:altronate dehydratase